jgi:hypothetical protein
VRQENFLAFLTPRVYKFTLTSTQMNGGAALNVFSSLFTSSSHTESVYVTCPYIAQINALADTQPRINAVEEYMLAKVISKGFSIKLASPGHNSLIADASSDPSIYAEWKNLAAAIFVQGMRYGFAVVQKFDNKRPPRVLDAAKHFTLGFSPETDFEERVYVVYSNRNRAQKVPMSNTVVLVMEEPTEVGHISSPWRRALLPLQRLDAYWGRHDVRDWCYTHPLKVFIAQHTASGDALIPNRNTIITPSDPDSGPLVMGRPMTLAAYEEAASAVKSKDYYLEISRNADEHRREELEKLEPYSRASELNQNSDPAWHPQLGHLSTEPYIDQLRPFHMLPQTVRCDNAVPQPSDSANFMQAIYNELYELTLATGCPPSLFTRESGTRFGVQDIYDELVDNRVENYQRKMERMLAELYIFLNKEEQATKIQAICAYEALRVKQQETIQRLQSELDKVEARIAALSAEAKTLTLIKTVEDLNRKANDYRAQIQRAQVYPEELQHIGPEECDDVEEGEEAPLDTQKEEEEKLRQELKVEVQFFPNRSITLDKISSLRNLGAITWDSARQLALSVCQQPQTKLATVEELLAEKKILARLGFGVQSTDKHSSKRQKRSSSSSEKE